MERRKGDKESFVL